MSFKYILHVYHHCVSQLGLVFSVDSDTNMLQYNNPLFTPVSPLVPLQAYHWYELGHKRGHFASVWQRSLYNVDGLKAQPWWTPKETGYTDLVKVKSQSVCFYVFIYVFMCLRGSKSFKTSAVCFLRRWRGTGRRSGTRLWL